MNREEALTATQTFINEHKPAEPQVNYTQQVLNVVQNRYNALGDNHPKKQLFSYVMGNLTQSAIQDPVRFEAVAKSSSGGARLQEETIKQKFGATGDNFNLLKLLKEKEGLRADLHNKMMGEVKKRREISKK